ncbi:hypothetical protein [Thalassobacillus pellis]|uniref:hypothetical protein n=1 Tax=Thalassobacillus pellis TaxID=748008 RepID=UPI0019615A12|nr:hypothetical protein [Thalassobacillus pellis]MBM7554086.1 hypothetical protein [Thalassobacillus pellis]
MKKFVFAVILFSLVSVGAVATAEAAGNGQWDYYGSYDLHYRSSYGNSLHDGHSMKIKN